MFRKKFRAEPAIALTVLYAALSLSARAGVQRQEEVLWPRVPGPNAGLIQEADALGKPPEQWAQTTQAMVEYDRQLVRSAQLTGVTQYPEGMFDHYLRYLEHRPLSMPAVDTVFQAIAMHYRVDGHPLPRIFACVDDGSVGKLIIAVFEA